MAQPRQGTVLERNRLIFGLAGAIAALLVISGWVLKRGAVSVRAERVIRQEIANVVSTNGKVEPVANFEAHAPSPATVEKILVHEGDWVEAGRLLLQLQDADARAQSAKALAELRAAEADLHNVQAGG